MELLRDYVTVAIQFTQEDPIHVASNEERELVAIKAALYARALTLCQGSLLLIENDRQLDFRVHTRGVIEAVMYLIALDRDAAFVTKMKGDDYKSRQSRAGRHLNAQDFNGTADVRQLLEEFLAQGLQGAKAIQVSALLKGSQFDRLYRTYRDISGDAAHVSITSLNRHYVENPADQSAKLIVHPPLDDIEIHVTFAELGISMTIAMLILMKVKAKTDLWDEFQALLVRYREVARASTTRRHEAENYSQ
ncbi:hypothetical protein EJC49_24565 [Aquibium carbonis]|uniref:Uncharacterized protein n=1 Tax=Aquibium carbonis TaxID=2495581 RepID=A0A3R9YJC3_9HYPH|nr:hypothetical protein EJC49_24565 [Aquibium carbonis]